MSVYKFGSITVSFDARVKMEITGMAVDGSFKFGRYFPVSIRHRTFELQLYFIEWADEQMELTPRVLKGGENMQTLHGRLRLGLNKVIKGRLKGQYSCSLKQACIKDDGIILHSNLFGATLKELDKFSGFDTQGTLIDFGATVIGTKEEVFGETGTSRNVLTVVFPPDSYAVPVAAFVITRVLPVYNGLCVR